MIRARHLYLSLKPFYGKGEEETYRRVEAGKYRWPRHIRVGKTLKSFVAALLTYNSTRRLGVVGLVMDHAWLQGIDWEAMERHQYIVRILSPFVIASRSSELDGW